MEVLWGVPELCCVKRGWGAEGMLQSEEGQQMTFLPVLLL